MNYKDGKWAKKILELQNNDGSWGFFHSLSISNFKQSMTTEQALRRLEILGFTINDIPVQKAVEYMNNCLLGNEKIPDYYEKGSDWKSYIDLMLSTWIKRFVPDNNNVNKISDKWAEIVNNSFDEGKFNQQNYETMYNRVLLPEKGKRIWGFMNFYGISILTNRLNRRIEEAFFDYVINYPYGIGYFGHNNPINVLPNVFQSKRTSEYIRMIDLLVNYKNKKCKEKLDFIKKWLDKNKIDNVEWDLGRDSKDNILFPLSDSWRKDEDRVKDCTFVISNIIKKL